MGYRRPNPPISIGACQQFPHNAHGSVAQRRVATDGYVLAACSHDSQRFSDTLAQGARVQMTLPCTPASQRSLAGK